MAREHLDRRLAAILIIDVAGYSRLTGLDEEGTHLRLRHIFTFLVKPKVAEHRGRVIKHTGDGMLVEFGSVVDSLQCAVDLQSDMKDQNSSSLPHQRIDFRAGLHVGDVIVDGGDLFGDDVNIASRLEQFAEPGGICVSSAVHERVRDQLDLVFDDIGLHKLKNISQPVRLHRVILDIPANSAPQRRPPLAFPEKPTLYIAPLLNMTEHPEVDALCQFHLNTIATELSLFRNLTVLYKGSLISDRDRHQSVVDVAKSFDAHYVLEGSVTVSQTSKAVRMQINLVDVLSGFHVWGAPFEAQVGKISALGARLKRRLVTLLPAYIEAAERIRVRRLDNADLQPFGYVLRGLEHFEEMTRDGHVKAADMFEQAIAHNPTFARAYAALSRVHNHRHRYRWSENPDESLQKSLDLARKAVRLDPTDPRGLAELGQVFLFMKNVEAAIKCYRRALGLNPNDTYALAHLAEALVPAKQPEEALRLIDRAISLNPFPPDEYFWFKADALFSLRRYTDVIATADQMQDPSEAYRLVAASYALIGQLEQARIHAALVLDKHGEFRISQWIELQPDSESDDCARFAYGLGLAGLPH